MSELATGLDELLAAAAGHRASDVHLTAGQPARIRVDGDLVADARLRRSAVGGVARDRALRDHDARAARASSTTHHEVDLSHEVAGIGRFRVNVFRQLGQIAAAFRLIPEKAASARRARRAARSPAISRCARADSCS